MKKSEIPLTEAERHLLHRLYSADYAWTEQEVRQHLPNERFRQFVEDKLLTVTSTEIGPLVLLSAAGQRAVYGSLEYSGSTEWHINMAYTRLALQHLGWRQSTASETVDLETFDTTHRFCEVITPDGPALFCAKVTADGFSRRHIGRVAERLKSQALLHNFTVILAVPNAKKGRRLAERYGSFLKVLEVRPQTISGSMLARYQHPGPHPEQPAEGPYLGGEEWKTNPKYLDFPGHVLHILQQERSVRVAAALQSIEVDGVMSVALLRRFYGLEAADLLKALQVITTLRTSPRQATSETRVSFLTLDRRLAQQADSRLAHRAGTGCMRHLLDIPPDPERYRAEFRGLIKLESPDALWTAEDGAELALEYDNGTYSRDTIQTKLTTFSERGFRTVWGVSHARRQRVLTTLFGQQLHGNVLLTEWW
ncbi:hypothetical protein [Deinococcus fonticola]|uniref:hypothetical protein n=1 Tax=Deinococcus fonticola TaxID=2528713 RepID=UPI0010758712|nr:hypothetical protein [Deinococcus fonticola]